MDGIRLIEKALGSTIKLKQKSEEPCHQKLGKSVVFTQNLAAGTQIMKDHLTVKVGQPVGRPPQNLDKLVGKTLTRNVEQDETLTSNCVI